MPLALTLRLIYSDPLADEWYSMVVYNDTVQIVEAHRTTPDFQLYSMYVACAGLLGLAGWVVQRRLMGPKGKRELPNWVAAWVVNLRSRKRRVVRLRRLPWQEQVRDPLLILTGFQNMSVLRFPSHGNVNTRRFSLHIDYRH